MAGVAGTAVGVISLGIQVCQGLISYYHAYHDQDEKIRDILCNVQGLSNTLEVAHVCLIKANAARLVAISQAVDSIIACAGAIHRLERLLQRCRQTVSPTGYASERIQLALRKAAFPFQQSTIRDFSETVKGLQANVSLALQTLQLEASGHLLNDASEVLRQTVTTSHDISRIGHELNDLSEQLGASRGIIKEVASDTSAVAKTLRRELPLVSLKASQAAAEIGGLRLSMSSVDRQMTVLGQEVNSGFSGLEQRLDSLPGAVEHKIVALMDSYFTERCYSGAGPSISMAHIVRVHDIGYLPANNE
ncbi:hypothetical protein A1O7_05097 [Cladophialophora yegresii CBS 114405]|uniref:Fungal N-terminal domain-containing protein n=1 Tax=Cladophialophora yegresii CBS 114405 TaxID=1182544 RepID=W9WRI0_9EURO|nr:uncharacterized protein A1O7_05097 [Cladophialophora yegresii CBS 114405]EXJ60944.1 hypothetical protein A1O7_05097 [Cladophialophora yegresii CBS 114405]